MTQSTFDALMAFVQTTLEAVDGIGKVFRADRLDSGGKFIYDKLTEDGVRHFWTIMRHSYSEERFDVEGSMVRTHNITLHGVRAYGDDDTYTATSEKAWNTLLEKISDAFRDPHVFDVTLGDRAAGQASPMQLTTNEKRVLQPDSRMSHYAEFLLTPQEVIPVS